MKLGDEQFALADRVGGRRACWRWSGMGVEPGLSDVFARYAADHLFSADRRGRRARRRQPRRSTATTSRRRSRSGPRSRSASTRRSSGSATAASSRPRRSRSRRRSSSPRGSGRSSASTSSTKRWSCPAWVDCRRVTFKYGLGDEFIEVLRVLHKTGLDSTSPVRCGGVEVAPRDVVAAALPNPATLGDRMHGKTCAAPG